MCYNNLYRNKLEAAKKAHHYRQICNSDNKTKTMWNIIKTIQGSNSVSKDMRFVRDGVEIPIEDVAHNFNLHFSNVTTTDELRDFDFLESNIPNFNKSLYFSPVSGPDVKSLVDKLKSSNSSGYDNISNNLIKKCKYVISGPLAHIINLSIKKVYFLVNLNWQLYILYTKREIQMIIIIIELSVCYAAFQNILNSISRISCQIFPKKITCFLLGNTVSSQTKVLSLHYVNSIIKLLKR